MVIARKTGLFYTCLIKANGEISIVKKFIKGFLIFIVSCAIIGVFVGYMLSKVPVLTVGARGFLLAVSAGQYDQAYALMTPGFKERNDLETFKTNLKISGIDQYKDIVWLKSETFPQGGGYAVGRMTTKQGTQFLIEFQFAVLEGINKNQKGWFINNIRLPRDMEDIGMLPPPPAKTQIPSHLPNTPTH